MQALICNAGKATRIKDDIIKKCLIRNKITGKSILWYQLDCLYFIHITRVVVVIAKGDFQTRSEIERIKSRFSGMDILCIECISNNILDTIEVGIEYITEDLVLKLDGDVCFINRKDLEPIKNIKQNTICVYEMEQVHRNSSTPILFENGFLGFWTPDERSNIAWSCIDVWKKETLIQIIKSSDENDRDYVLKQINNLIKKGEVISTVQINPVYEIDRAEDIDSLFEIWEEKATHLEKECSGLWKHLSVYPKFDEDKDERLKIDADVVLSTLAENCILSDIGSGKGELIKRLLDKIYLKGVIISEPNKNWINEIEKDLLEYDRKTIYNYTLEEYVNNQICADTTLLFGVIMYIINDHNLIKYLSKLNSKKLILKASEPDEKKFSRLFIDDFSEKLDLNYICIYRNINIVCEILRSSGWKIQTIIRDIYPLNLESKFGNRTFVIVAERP